MAAYLQFDGVDDYVSIGTMLSIAAEDSFEFYAELDGATDGTDLNLFGRIGIANSYASFYRDGRFFVQGRDTSRFDFTNPVPLSQVYSVRITLIGGNLEVFINGDSIGSFTCPATRWFVEALDGGSFRSQADWRLKVADFYANSILINRFSPTETHRIGASQLIDTVGGNHGTPVGFTDFSAALIEYYDWLNDPAAGSVADNGLTFLSSNTEEVSIPDWAVAQDEDFTIRFRAKKYNAANFARILGRAADTNQDISFSSNVKILFQIGNTVFFDLVTTNLLNWCDVELSRQGTGLTLTVTEVDSGLTETLTGTLTAWPFNYNLIGKQGTFHTADSFDIQYLSMEKTSGDNRYYDFNQSPETLPLVPELINGQHGTAVGFPTPSGYVRDASGVITGYRFNGVDTYCSVTNISLTGDYTIIADFTFDTNSFVLGEAGSTTESISVTASGIFFKYDDSGGSVNFITPLTQGARYKMQFVRSGGVTNCLDMEGNSLIQTTFSGNNTFLINAIGHRATAYADGVLHSLDINGQNYYDFTTGDTDQIIDTVGNNHATITNAPTSGYLPVVDNQVYIVANQGIGTKFPSDKSFYDLSNLPGLKTGSYELYYRPTNESNYARLFEKAGLTISVKEGGTPQIRSGWKYGTSSTGSIGPIGESELSAYGALFDSDLIKIKVDQLIDVDGKVFLELWVNDIFAGQSGSSTYVSPSDEPEAGTGTFGAFVTETRSAFDSQGYAQYLKIVGEDYSGNPVDLHYDFNTKDAAACLVDKNGSGFNLLVSGILTQETIPSDRDYVEFTNLVAAQSASASYIHAKVFGNGGSIGGSDLQKDQSKFVNGITIEGASGEFSGDLGDPNVAFLDSGGFYVSGPRVFKNIILKQSATIQIPNFGATGDIVFDAAGVSAGAHIAMTIKNASGKVTIADSVVKSESSRVISVLQATTVKPDVFNSTVWSNGGGEAFHSASSGPGFHLENTVYNGMGKYAGTITGNDNVSNDQQINSASSGIESLGVGTLLADLGTAFADTATGDYRIKQSYADANLTGQGWNGSDIAGWAYYDDATSNNALVSVLINGLADVNTAEDYNRLLTTVVEAIPGLSVVHSSSEVINAIVSILVSGTANINTLLSKDINTSTITEAQASISTTSSIAKSIASQLAVEGSINTTSLVSKSTAISLEAVSLLDSLVEKSSIVGTFVQATSSLEVITTIQKAISIVVDSLSDISVSILSDTIKEVAVAIALTSEGDLTPVLLAAKITAAVEVLAEGGLDTLLSKGSSVAVDAILANANMYTSILKGTESTLPAIIADSNINTQSVKGASIVSSISTEADENISIYVGKDIESIDLTANGSAFIAYDLNKQSASVLTSTSEVGITDVRINKETNTIVIESTSGIDIVLLSNFADTNITVLEIPVRTPSRVLEFVVRLDD